MGGAGKANPGFLLRASVAGMGIGAMVVLAYLFHFAMVRMLPSAEYGELGVLIGIFAVLTVPVTNLQSMLSREVTRLLGQGKKEEAAFFLRKYLWKFGKPGAAVFILAIAGAVFFPDFLPACLALAGAAIAYLIAVEGAYYQGAEKTLLASSIQGLIALFKLGFAAALVWAGLGYAGAAAAIPLGVGLAFLALLFPVLALGRGKEYQISLGKEIGLVVLASFFMTLFLYLDLFSVRLFLGPGEAGAYNAAAITSRIIYFLATGLAIVIVPQSAKISWDRKRLGWMLVASCAGLAIPLFAIAGFSGTIMNLFYTPEFASGAYPLALLSLAMFLFSGFFLIANIMWAKGDEKTPLVISAILVPVDAALLYFLVPGMGMEGAAISTLATSALALILGVFAFISRKN